MARRLAMVILCILGSATGVAAQGSGTIPIQRDLRNLEESDRRLGLDRRVPVDPNVTPSNPSGVAGFSGPPGTYGDSVNNVGPLPPGASGNDQ